MATVDEHVADPTASSDAGGSATPLTRMVLRWVGPLLAYAAFCGVLYFFVEGAYRAQIATLVVFWALMGMSWNLIGGYAGQVSLGHAAFIGLGSYTSIILFVEANVTPWIGLFAGAAVAVIAALITGIPTLRLTGVFFGLATLAYPLILQPVFTWLGYRELLIPARPDKLYAMQFQDLRWYAVLLAGMVVLVWYLTGAIERSRLRPQLQAVRQDEAAAKSAGIDSFRLKLLMFVLSAAIAGMGGVVYAQILFVVTPDTVFGLQAVVETLVVCFLGGAGRRSGPIIGAAILIPATQYLETTFSALSGASSLAYGLLLVVVIILIPGGILRAGVLARFRTVPREVPPADIGGAAVAVNVDEKPEREKGPGQVVLEGQGLGKTYGSVVALQDVDLQLREAEFLGIVGPNGAGKTTLFDLLTGYQAPTSGSVRFADKNVTGWNPDRLARAGLRRTFQVARPLGELTVFENVFLGAMRSRDPTEHDDRLVAWEALAVVGLVEQANLPAGDLSPSQLRLLELARSLAAKPTVLLLDEPFAGLDPSERAGFVDVLHRHHQAGLSIVLVDHDIRTVAGCVQRLFVIDNGVQIADGRPKEVVREQAVVDAYLGSRWQHAEG